jgi:hypothetical protein
MSWRADYVAELNERDDRLDFNGWVTLTNHSGAAYPNARLQLVAGDLNRVRRQPPMLREPMAMAAKMADVEDLKQEPLFEYHLYTLHRISAGIEECQERGSYGRGTGAGSG